MRRRVFSPSCCSSWVVLESNQTAEAGRLQRPWRTSARTTRKRKKATWFPGRPSLVTSGSSGGYRVGRPSCFSVQSVRG